jgi:multidrug efflux system outer membrane protein
MQSNLLQSPASFWTLGPSLLLETIFDGGRRAAQVKISRADYEDGCEQLSWDGADGFPTGEDGLAASRLLAQESIDQRDAADAAQRTEDLALIRYRDGASDYLDVVTAQTAALMPSDAALAGADAAHAGGGRACPRLRR